MNARRGYPWLAVLPFALAGAVGCGTESASSPSSAPPPLSLATSSGVASDLPLAAKGTGNGGWRLVGTLPAQTPGPHPIYELPAARTPRATVTALADALGVPHVRPVAGGWAGRDHAGTTLIVRDTPGQPWTYTQAPCPLPISPDQAAYGVPQCAVSSGTVSSGGGSAGVASAAPATKARAHPPSPVPEPSPPPTGTPAQTRAAAQRLLDAIGLTGTHLNVRPGYASADPVVVGAPTAGLATTLSVDAAGRVTYASGWLGAATAGARYPLIDADAAFRLLADRPLPMLGAPAILCPATAHGAQQCPGYAPQVVTGARLGLMLTYRTDGRPLLVPAWLFTVRGSDTPVAQVAVAARFLAAPTPPGGIRPVATKPGSAPGAPAEPPTATSVSPQSYRTEDGGRTLVLQITDGICPPATYTAETKETDSEVVVSVTKHVEPQSPSTPPAACPELARIFDVRAHLDRPLGDRTVLAPDGTKIPPAG